MGKSKKLMSKNDIKKYVKEKGEDELLKDDLIEISVVSEFETVKA